MKTTFSLRTKCSSVFRFLTIKTYFDAVAKFASDKVEVKWKDKLSDTDVWTYSHARKLLSFVRESGVAMPISNK